MALAALASASSIARADRVVFPPEAIVDAMHLPVDEFRLLNPGIDITGVGLTDEGFYVRYIHEDLVYYFGPIADLATARRWRDDMLAIRDRLIVKRSTLETSTVELVRFTFDRLRGGQYPGEGDDWRGHSDAPDVNGDGSIDSRDDINGDGVVDQRDLAAFREAGRGADVNGDGIVDGRDDINGDGEIDGDDIRALNQIQGGRLDVNGDGASNADDDINGDGAVNGEDLKAFREAGRNTDVNGDGVVDSRDDINGDGEIDGDDVQALREQQRTGQRSLARNGGPSRDTVRESGHRTRAGDDQQTGGQTGEDGQQMRAAGTPSQSGEPGAAGTPGQADPSSSPGQPASSESSSSSSSPGSGDGPPTPAQPGQSGGINIWRLLKMIFGG